MSCLHAECTSATLVDWVGANFLLPDEVNEEGFHLVHMRDGGKLFFELGQMNRKGIMEGTEMTIYTGNMDLAAEMVQSLLGHLQITELNTVVQFPNDEVELR